MGTSGDGKANEVGPGLALGLGLGIRVWFRVGLRVGVIVGVIVGVRGGVRGGVVCTVSLTFGQYPSSRVSDMRPP